MRLEELPMDCIAVILSHTSVWDVCRLACVNRTFSAAVRSVTVWGNLLPPDYALLCPEATLMSKREIVETLTAGIFSDNGRQRFVLLRRSGGVCRFLSVAGMETAWGDDKRFWRWECSKSSCFSTVAHLLAVCWLEVTGTWKCSLPPGVYSVVWRLKVANPQGGRFRFLVWKKPLSFVVTTSDGQALERELDLGQVHCKVFEEWFEFEVGQIVFHGKRMESKELTLVFSIMELDCSYWKGGLYLDCLALRPSIAENEPVYIKHPEMEPGKVRVRPGVF